MGILIAATGGAAKEASLQCPPLLESADRAATTSTLPGIRLRSEPRTLAWRKGEIYAGMGGEGRVVVLNAAGQPQRELVLGSEEWALASEANLLAGGKADTSASSSGSHLPSLAMLRATDGTLLWEQKMDGFLDALAFSPDGKALLALSHGGTTYTLEVRDARSGKLRSRCELNFRLGPTDGAWMALPDAKHAILSQSDTGRLTVIDVDQGKDVTVDYFGGSGAEMISGEDRWLSSDGRFLVAMPRDGWSHHYECNLWSLEPGTAPRIVFTMRARPDAGTGYFQTAAFSADSRTCAIASGNCTDVFDLPSGKFRGRIADGGSLAALDENGGRIVVACEERLRVDRTDVRNVAGDGARPSAPETLENLAVQANGPLAATTNFRSVVVWDTASGKAVAEITNPEPKFGLNAVAIHPDGKAVFFCSGRGIWWRDVFAESGVEPQRMRHWNEGTDAWMWIALPEDGKSMVLLRNGYGWVLSGDGKSYREIFDHIRPLVFDHDRAQSQILGFAALGLTGDRLLVARENRCELYELSPETLLAELPTTKVLAVTRNLERVAVRDWGKTREPAILDTGKGTTIWSIPWALLAKREDLGAAGHGAFNEGGNQLAITFENHEAALYGFAVFDLESRKILRLVKTQRGGIRDLAFGNHDRTITVLNRDSSLQTYLAPKSGTASDR